MIHKTFNNDSTIHNIRDFNFIGRENNLLRRPSVGHLVDWQDIGSNTWDIQNIIEGTMVKINATLTLAFSFWVISQQNLRTLRIIKTWEGLFCWNHVLISSRIIDKGRRSYSACNEGIYSLLVFETGSSFLLACATREGDVVLLQDLIHHINIFLHAWDLRMKALRTIRALATFNFTFILLKFLLLGVIRGILGSKMGLLRKIIK